MNALIFAQVTKPALFYRRVSQVNTEGLKLEANQCFSGHIAITSKEGIVKPYFGLIAYDEFELEYGFQLLLITQKHHRHRATENPVTE